MNRETCFGDFILMLCMIENKTINKLSNVALSCLEVNNLISVLWMKTLAGLSRSEIQSFIIRWELFPNMTQRLLRASPAPVLLNEINKMWSVHVRDQACFTPQSEVLHHIHSFCEFKTKVKISRRSVPLQCEEWTMRNKCAVKRQTGFPK